MLGNRASGDKSLENAGTGRPSAVAEGIANMLTAVREPAASLIQPALSTLRSWPGTLPDLGDWSLSALRNANVYLKKYKFVLRSAEKPAIP